jgi:hypothetical protein
VNIAIWCTGLAALYTYLLLLAHRVGHSGRHARTWARPRPLRLLSHGRHDASHPQPESRTAVTG